MWYEEIPEGLVLYHLAKNDGVADFYRFSMNHQTLKRLAQALQTEEIFWEYAPGQFSVRGTRRSLTLTFVMSGPPFGSNQVTLDAHDTGEFIRTVEKMAR